jgi:chromosome partitioning protein
MTPNAKTFCLINYKGGTGKTCTLVNLAHKLSLNGYKTLIIDTDPQGSISYHLGINKSTKTLYNAIIDPKNITSCIQTARENLDIIASNEHLFALEHHMHQLENREHTLTQCLNPLKQYYDYILIDCGPSMNLMNQNAMLFAQNILVPVSMDYMTLLGVKQLINNILLLNKHFNASIKVSKIIPTFYNNRNKKTKQVYNSLYRVFSDVISKPIRTSVLISEAAGKGKTIWEFSAIGPSHDDYNNLTKEVLNL